MDQWLVMDFEAAVGQRLPQILLHGQAGLCASVHRRFEEAVGAAAARLGGIHGKVGVLDELVMIGAVQRRHGDADRGIGRKLMAEALIWLADRLVYPRDEGGDLVGRTRGGLDHGELVAAKPRDQVAVPEAAPDAVRYRLQELVADVMPKGIVDTLELVDVDVEQGKLFASSGLLQFALDPL